MLVESIWSGRFRTSVSRDPFHSHLLQNRDLAEPQLLLSGALNEDTLDDGWVRTATAVIFLVSLTAENLLRIERH